MRKNTGHTVYFMKPARWRGPIKIGCTIMPEKRIETLACWSPVPLETLVTIPGSFELERKIQNFFGDLHTHREWFRAAPALLECIAKLKAGVPIEEVIDLTTKRPSIHGPALRKRFTPENKLRLRLSTAVGRIERRLNVKAPDDVKKIVKQWDWQGYTRNFVAVTTDDRAVVESFIAQHVPRYLPPDSSFAAQAVAS